MRAIQFAISLIVVMGLGVWAWEAFQGWRQERRATRAFKPIEDELERMWNTKGPS